MKRLSKKARHIIDIIQWVLILLSVGVCIYIYQGNNRISSQDIIEREKEKYVKIYDSQKISYLEKQNKALYDSIKHLKNVESAIQIKYVYKHTIDTVFVKEEEITKDSIYNYCYDNDTLKYDITIKANDIKWHKSEFKLHDNFTIINLEENNKNTTIINTSPNVDIIETTTWHRKQKIKDKIFYGPSINVGYGIINRKPDMFIGFSVGYNLN